MNHNETIAAWREALYWVLRDPRIRDRQKQQYFLEAAFPRPQNKGLTPAIGLTFEGFRRMFSLNDRREFTKKIVAENISVGGWLAVPVKKIDDFCDITRDQRQDAFNAFIAAGFMEREIETYVNESGKKRRKVRIKINPFGIAKKLDEVFSGGERDDSNEVEKSEQKEGQTGVKDLKSAHCGELTAKINLNKPKSELCVSCAEEYHGNKKEKDSPAGGNFTSDKSSEPGTADAADNQSKPGAGGSVESNKTRNKRIRSKPVRHKPISLPGFDFDEMEIDEVLKKVALSDWASKIIHFLRKSVFTEDSDWKYRHVKLIRRYAEHPVFSQRMTLQLVQRWLNYRLSCEIPEGYDDEARRLLDVDLDGFCKWWVFICKFLHTRELSGDMEKVSTNLAILKADPEKHLAKAVNEVMANWPDLLRAAWRGEKLEAEHVVGFFGIFSRLDDDQVEPTTRALIDKLKGQLVRALWAVPQFLYSSLGRQLARWLKGIKHHDFFERYHAIELWTYIRRNCCSEYGLYPDSVVV